tara:strand:+ start:401 stop:850 length:450 start_codon:yes stop_codon:yes gene_type:complete
MDLFLSTFETKIDRKGRVSIPARFRSILERKNEELILFTLPNLNYLHGCGESYIKRLWDYNLELDQNSDESIFIQDILSDSTHFKVDAEGRVLLTNNHLKIANLSDNVLFAGRGETFQIWSPEDFHKNKTFRESKTIKNKPMQIVLRKK